MKKNGNKTWVYKIFRYVKTFLHTRKITREEERCQQNEIFFRKRAETPQFDERRVKLRRSSESECQILTKVARHSWKGMVDLYKFFYTQKKTAREGENGCNDVIKMMI